MNARAVVTTPLGLLAILFTCQLISFACTCDLPASSSVKQQVTASLKKSSVVFSGTAVQVMSDPGNAFVLVRFKVEKVLKGNNASQLTIRTGRGSGDCGFTFEVGEQYLVYAYGPDKALETNICQRTTTLADATADLRILGGAHLVIKVYESPGQPRDQDAREPADQERVRSLGPEARVDLLIFFNQDVTHKQVEDFWLDVLSKPDVEGRGHFHRDGVGDIARIDAVQGHEGIAVSFFPNASQVEREAVERDVRASPIVHRILKDIAPVAVKSIE